MEEKNAQVVVQPQLPRVLCDEVKMREVFKNLLSNAVKFTRAVPPRVEIGCSEERDGFMFFVKDNGLGIEERYLEKIFEVFFRIHSRDEYEGTGLGLHLCKKIVEEHGGRIWVNSTPGLGSTFYFTIPMHQRSSADECLEPPGDIPNGAMDQGEARSSLGESIGEKPLQSKKDSTQWMSTR